MSDSRFDFIELIRLRTDVILLPSIQDAETFREHLAAENDKHSLHSLRQAFESIINHHYQYLRESHNQYSETEANLRSNNYSYQYMVLNDYITSAVKNYKTIFDYDDNFLAKINYYNSWFASNAGDKFEADTNIMAGLHKLYNNIISKPSNIPAEERLEIFSSLIQSHINDLYFSPTATLSDAVADIRQILPNVADQLQRRERSLNEQAWNAFSKGVCCAIHNINLNCYPVARLNVDEDYICITIDSEELEELKSFPIDPNIEKSSELIQSLSSATFLLELTLACQRQKIPLAVEGMPLISSTNRDGIIAYKINLSPESLDHILKLNATLYAYRNDDHPFKLRKDFTMDTDFIRLFPIIPTENSEALIRAAGCQMAELPTLQLLKMLPDFDGKVGKYHWVPTRVVDQLSIDVEDIQQVMNNILMSNKFRNDPINIQGSEGVYSIDSSQQHPGVRIVDIEPATSRFYAQFGNNSLSELAHCRSFEVKQVYFLECIREHLEKKLQNVSKDDPKINKINSSITLVGHMIEQQKQKEALASGDIPADPCNKQNDSRSRFRI